MFLFDLLLEALKTQTHNQGQRKVAAVAYWPRGLGGLQGFQLVKQLVRHSKIVKFFKLQEIDSKEYSEIDF